MDDPPTFPDHPPPGPLPGVALGAGAGALVGAVWAYGAWDVAFALSAVLACLLGTLTIGVADWRPFGLGMLGGAAVVLGAIVLLVV